MKLQALDVLAALGRVMWKRHPDLNRGITVLQAEFRLQPRCRNHSNIQCLRPLWTDANPHQIRQRPIRFDPGRSLDLSKRPEGSAPGTGAASPGNYPPQRKPCSQNITQRHRAGAAYYHKKPVTERGWVFCTPLTFRKLQICSAYRSRD
jgi:hypothetical protein